MEDNNNAVITKRPPFWACITIVTFLAVILVAQILVFGSPDVHMTMIFALAFSSVVLLLTGTKWDAKKASVQLRLYACLFINKMMNCRAGKIYLARIELYF